MYDAGQGETRTRTTLDLGYALTCACVAFRLCPLIHSSSLCVSMRAVLWVHSYFKIHCAASLASAPYGDHHPDSISSLFSNIVICLSGIRLEPDRAVLEVFEFCLVDLCVYECSFGDLRLKGSVELYTHNPVFHFEHTCRHEGRT